MDIQHERCVPIPFKVSLYYHPSKIGIEATGGTTIVQRLDNGSLVAPVSREPPLGAVKRESETETDYDD